MLDALLTFLTNHDVLSKDLWAETNYVPDSTYEFSEDEKNELLDAYVLDFAPCDIPHLCLRLILWIICTAAALKA